MDEAAVRVLRGVMAERGKRHTALNGVLGKPIYVRHRLGDDLKFPLSVGEFGLVCSFLGVSPGDVMKRAELRIAGGTPLPPSWPEERPARRPEWGGDGTGPRDTPENDNTPNVINP